jgi:hypothetical protein
MFDAEDFKFLMFILACGQANEDDWNQSHDRSFEEAVQAMMHKMENAIVPIEGGHLQKAIEKAKAWQELDNA